MAPTAASSQSRAASKPRSHAADQPRRGDLARDGAADRQRASKASGGCRWFIGCYLGELACNPPSRFQHVVGVLQTQKVAIGQREKTAQSEVCISGDAARSIDDRMNAVSRYANRLG